MVNLDGCNGSCNTLVDPSGKICVPNKIKALNLNFLNMITRIKNIKKIYKTYLNVVLNATLMV